MKKGFKRCLRYVKKYLSHYQNSVFRGDITPSKLIGLKEDLKKIINEEEDFVCIIKVLNSGIFGEEILGGKMKLTGEELIL